MTERTSFYRKLAYLGAIVVLAFPIVWLSLPATTTQRPTTTTATNARTITPNQVMALAPAGLTLITPSVSIMSQRCLGRGSFGAFWPFENADVLRRLRPISRRS